MDASTQTENISTTSRILNTMLLFIVEETMNDEYYIQRKLNIDRYEEDVYNSYFDQDRIDMMADEYNSKFDSSIKYTTHLYYNIDDFHRGKSSNAKKKSKRSVSCAPIPDAHDKNEEQNAYYDVTFSKGDILYY